MNSTGHWDNYWLGTSSLNSFGEGEAASGYQGELLQLWHHCFKPVPVNGKVLDVGTGNGAIAVAARRYSNDNQLNLTIYGTDAAKIKPLQVFANNSLLTALLQTIHFYPECKMETLPFADASIDLVTSQFAFEYAERAPALRECLRVLKPKGRLTAIIHHTGSDIAIDSAVGQTVLTEFLYNTAFFEHARTLLTALAAQAKQPNQPEYSVQAQQANQALMAVSQQIKGKVPAQSMHWFNDVMSRVAKLIMNFSPANIAQLDVVEQSLAAFWQRLNDQHQASMSPDDANVFRKQLTTAGHVFQLAEVAIEQQLFGWLLQIEK